jgi:magnesium transporter
VCAYLPGLVGHPLSAAETVQGRQQLHIAMALGLSMFSAVMVSTSLGLLLPFLFRKIGVDPAISSGPLVTTANDSISVAIYMILTILLTR